MDQLQRTQCTEALMQVVLTECKAISLCLAEVIEYLEEKQHLAALGAFQGIDQKFKFLGTLLEAAARLDRK